MKPQVSLRFSLKSTNGWPYSVPILFLEISLSSLQQYQHDDKVKFVTSILFDVVHKILLIANMYTYKAN